MGGAFQDKDIALACMDNIVPKIAQLAELYSQARIQSHAVSMLTHLEACLKL